MSIYTNESYWSKRAHEVFYQNLGKCAEQLLQLEPKEALHFVISERVHKAQKWKSKCESPIEEIMAAILPFVTDNLDFLYDEDDDLPGVGAVVKPQAEIGQYRVDFLITCHWGDSRRLLAIECDGHNFHDRTREQAARDKSRDRQLMGESVRVLRYTGYELYRDPVAIGAEIEKILTDLYLEAGTEAGTIPPPGKYWK